MRISTAIRNDKAMMPTWSSRVRKSGAGLVLIQLGGAGLSFGFWVLLAHLAPEEIGQLPARALGFAAVLALVLGGGIPQLLPNAMKARGAAEAAVAPALRLVQIALLLS